jgi:hypothetical protein
MRKLPVVLSLALTATAFSALSVATADAETKVKPTKYGYVVNRIVVPTTRAQAREVGLDLDKDGEADNQFGMALAALASQGFDFQAPVDASVSSGSLVTLLTLRATSLKNAKDVKLRLLSGLPKANPDLNGGGSFRVDKSAPVTELKAKIKQKVVLTKRGAVRIEVPTFFSGQTPVAFELRKGRITAKCTKKRCTAGKVGGALHVEELDAVFIPQFGTAMRAVVAEDCPSGYASCANESTGKTILDLFDSNDDDLVTDQEIRDNSLIQSLLAPDLDLDGNGENDALSVGFGFTAANAKVRGG